MFNRRESLPYLHCSTTLTPDRNDSITSTSSNLIPNLTTVNLVKVVPNITRLLNRRIISPTLIIVLFFFLYWSNHLSSNLPRDSLDLLNEKYQIGLNRLQSLRPIIGNFRSGRKKVLKESIWNNVGVEIELGASLETRLRDWENSPLENIEASDYVIEGLKTCSPERVVPNQNNFLLETSHFLWSSLNTHKIGELRAELTSYLRKASAEGKMSEAAWGTGKGLVFTAGNADTFSRVLTSLKLLNNHLETRLPVEIFSFPGEVPDDKTRRELKKYGAKLLVVENAVKDSNKAKSYHIKATAIIRSSFREVLYLDSDNLPTASLAPEEDASAEHTGTWAESAGLWEAKAYKNLGVMFWSDYWRTGADNPIWAIIGVTCRDEWEQESGQILIDKALHLDALLLAEFMLDSSRFKFWMHFSDGDKDIFRYSFLALRKRWGVPGRYVGVGAFAENTPSGFGGHTMLQHDHKGRAIFVHANILKHVEGIIEPGFAWGRTKSLSLPSPLKRMRKGKYFLNETIDEFIDEGVHCDQLANADVEGVAIKAANPAVRRRAVMERGLSINWHGSCCQDPHALDMVYSDKRSWEDINLQLSNALDEVTRNMNGIHEEVEGEEEDDDEDEEVEPYDQNSEFYTPSATSLTSDGTQLFWGLSALVIRKWSDDIRLKGFEQAFYDEGGILNFQ